MRATERKISLLVRGNHLIMRALGPRLITGAFELRAHARAAKASASFSSATSSITLRRRELDAAGAKLTKETGLPYQSTTGSASA